MSYIPIVPHVPSPQSSPRVRRLAVELEDTIARFEDEQGRLNAAELQQALDIVERSTKGSEDASPGAAKLALAAAALLGLLVFSLNVLRGGLPALGRAPLTVGLVMGLLAVGAVVALAAGRSE